MLVEYSSTAQHQLSGSSLEIDVFNQVNVFDVFRLRCCRYVSHNAPLWNRNVHISFTKWCTVWYLSLWDLWDGTIPTTGGCSACKYHVFGHYTYSTSMDRFYRYKLRKLTFFYRQFMWIVEFNYCHTSLMEYMVIFQNRRHIQTIQHWNFSRRLLSLQVMIWNRILNWQRKIILNYVGIKIP